MTDMKVCLDRNVFPPSAEPSTRTLQIENANTSRSELTGQYVAVSPKGVTVTIPKELFVALSDFIKTRKCPGSVTIQFRKGEILCVESVAKKTYKNNL
jgi:hypothetical protein